MNQSNDPFKDACSLAESLGYIVRKRWLDGVGAEPSQVGEKKWIFVDDMQAPEEQANTVMQAIRGNAESRRAA